MAGSETLTWEEDGTSTMLDIAKARKELASKSLLDIERATAETWGARAAASYALSLEERSMTARLRRFHEGENFRQEALEHGAMAEDMAFLGELQAEIADHRRAAHAALPK